MAVNIYNELATNASTSHTSLIRMSDGEEWIAWTSRSDAVVAMNPRTGQKHVVITGYTTNGYTKVTISKDYPRRIFFYGFGANRMLLDLDLDTGGYDFIHLGDKYPPYSGGLFSFAWEEPYHVWPSTDGKLYLSGGGYRQDAGVVEYDPATKTASIITFSGNNQINYRQALLNIDAVEISNAGSLNGVYVPLPVDDTLINRLSNIQTDIISAFPGWNYERRVWVHWSDRAASPANRRVLFFDGTSWKLIDVLAPSVFHNTQVSHFSLEDALANANWIDELSAPSSVTSSYDKFTDHNATLGASIPGIDHNLVLSGCIRVGRHIWIAQGGYRANKTIFYMIAIDPATGNYLPFQVFDWANDEFPNNGNSYVDCVCNFGGAYGYSASNEYVRFIYNGDRAGSQDIGFMRLDGAGDGTNDFVAYDPAVDPSGYVVAYNVDLRSYSDPNGLGCAITHSTGVSTETINAEDWLVDDNFNIVCALRTEYEQEKKVYGKAVDISFRVMADRNRPSLQRTIVAENIPTIASTLGGAIEPSADLVAVAGILYGGESIIDFSNLSAIDKLAQFSGRISIRGVLNLDDATGLGRVLVYGYLNTAYILDFNDNSRTEIVLGVGTANAGHVIDASYAAFSGALARTASYKSTYFLTRYVDKSSLVVTDFVNLPTQLDRQLAISIRESYGLPDDDYSDSTVEAVIQLALSADPGLSRADIINEFKASAQWSIFDLVGYTYSSTRTVVWSLLYKGYAALRGIRIDSTGSGDYIDSDDDIANVYQSLAYLADNDFTSVSDTDYSIIRINTSDFPQGYIGYLRIEETDDYIALFENRNTDSTGKIFIISKSTLDTIAKGTKEITAFDRIVDVALGSTGSAYGFGLGGNNSSSSTSADFTHVEGNVIYFTVQTVNGSSPYPCVMTVDCSTGATSVIAESSNIRPRNIDYLVSNDSMGISTGTEYVRITGFSGETLPIDLADAVVPSEPD
jgi:hypothetical protein